MTELYQKDWHCPVCGDVVEQTGKGRPREYHPECRELNNMMTFMETKIAEWPKEKRNKVMRKFIKSNMQRMANLTASKEWSK